MSAQVTTPIIVMGVSGCGKTTLAGALARQLSAPCLDADDFHPARNVEKMRAGMPLTDDDRQPWLASLNAELRCRALDGQRVVLACSALRQRYRDALAADIPAVHWIFLDGSAAEIAARMRAREGHYMPESLLRSQFDALERPIDAISICVSLTPAEQLQFALASLPE